MCYGVVGQITTMPSIKDKIIEFKNFNNQFEHPFICTLDFECITSKCSIKKGSYEKYQKHIPSGYKLVLIDKINKTTKEYLYR